MSANLIVCTGSYATTPYYYQAAELNLWSMEELCFYLMEHSCWLEQSLVNMELINWISEECKLPELAKELRKYVNKKEALASFVRIILERMRYASQREIGELLVAIKCQNTMDTLALEKQRGDFFLNKGQIRKAIGIYRELLSKANHTNTANRATIVYNLGVAYARLFEFDKASDCFMEAFGESNEKECYMAFLAAKRMVLSDEEYVKFVTSQVVHYDLSVELEQRMGSVIQEYETYPERIEYENIQKELDGARSETVEKYLGERLSELKKEYQKNQG